MSQPILWIEPLESRFTGLCNWTLSQIQGPTSTCSRWEEIPMTFTFLHRTPSQFHTSYCSQRSLSSSSTINNKQLCSYQGHVFVYQTDRRQDTSRTARILRQASRLNHSLFFLRSVEGKEKETLRNGQTPKHLYLYICTLNHHANDLNDGSIILLSIRQDIGRESIFTYDCHILQYWSQSRRQSGFLCIFTQK